MVVSSFMLTFIISIFIPNQISIPLNVGVFIGCFLLIYIALTRHVVRYLSIVAEGVMKIAKGELDYRLPLLRHDELGIVASNINHMANQLQEQMNRERELEQSKMELITYVSHDLRTPLTSIIGYLDLLHSQTFQDESERERYLESAIHKTQQLKTLIDDLFEYTRLTYGEVRLSFQEIDLNSLLEQMMSEFEPVAKEQGVSLRKVTASEPIMLWIDTEKMVRAIDNLFMNALKFSYSPGDIRVGLYKQGSRVTLSIENNGKPITKEQEERLFERFYRLEPVRSDTYMPSGSGLGLTIARNIVELHGGRIQLFHNNGHYQVRLEFGNVGK